MDAPLLTPLPAPRSATTLQQTRQRVLPIALVVLLLVVGGLPAPPSAARPGTPLLSVADVDLASVVPPGAPVPTTDGIREWWATRNLGAPAVSSIGDITVAAVPTGDDDGDGIQNQYEDANTDLDDDADTNPGPDTDGDTVADYLDNDDDGDGVLTSLENADPNGDGDPRDAQDSDWDGEPDYLDAPTALANTPVATEQKISDTSGGLTGGLAIGDDFGSAVVSIGDLDGDGIVDVAAGAPGDNSGAVYVLLLNGDGTVKAEQKIADGVGGLTATLDVGDQFGTSVAGLGDLDGDGLEDIAVGARGDDDGGTERGAVHILFLNADGTVRAEQKISSSVGGLAAALDDADSFGAALAQLGDLNDDGTRDLGVGAPGDDDAGTDRGAVHILFLDTDGTVAAEQKISDTQGGLISSLDNSDEFGRSLTTIGDIDADGTNDIAVGAWRDDDGAADAGAVHVLRLNNDGSVKAEQKISGSAGGLAAPLDADDRFGQSLSGIGDVDANGVGDLIVGAHLDDDAVADGGAAYILHLDTDGTVLGEQKISGTTGGFTTTLDPADELGSAVASLGDLDGDGLPSIALGAAGDDDGTTDAGAIHIVELDSTCADADSDGLCNQFEDANTDLDGNPATNPGPDTDGDTVPNYLDPDDDGDGLPTVSEEPDPNADGDPRDAVDSDFDGQPDYLDVANVSTSFDVSTEQKISATTGGLAAALDDLDAFAASVATIGDIDGDGITDVAVGAPFDDDGSADRGAVHILMMNADGTVKSEQKISATAGGLSATLDSFDRFGYSVARLGDLDGDGINDIAVGADFDDDGGNDRGAVHILFLDSDGTVKVEQKISATTGGLAATLDDSDWFGHGVAGIGDLDGDGVNDVLVGAPGDDDGNVDNGAAHVLFLNSDGTVKAEQKISDTVGGFSAVLDTQDRLGTSVAAIGDINGDGTADVALGADFDDDGGPDRGAVYVAFLNSDGTVAFEQKISSLVGDFDTVLDDGDLFGDDIAGIGDLDDDGTPDMVIGASGDDDGGPGRGAVHALLLRPDGTVKRAEKISSTSGGFTGPLADGDQFGSSVAGLGDLDGDGRTDVVVGAPSDDDGGTGRGAAWEMTLTSVTTVHVNSTGDAGDAVPGDDVCDTGGTNATGDTECTLRAAIEEANASANIDTIEFDIPTADAGYNGSGNGEFTISPATNLPVIGSPATIDGYTQRGSSPASAAFPAPFDGTLLIEVDGTAGATTGVSVGATSTVRGLVVNEFTTTAIHVSAGTATQIVGNLIGTDVTGAVDQGNNIGIRVQSDDTFVGGPAAADRNVIAGNNTGIWIENPRATIQGNYIGVAADGLTALAQSDGIYVDDASDVLVGGVMADAGNLVSGNQEGISGVWTFGGSITLQNNRIGTDHTGNGALPNTRNGVQLSGGTNHVVGTPGSGNVLSGNTWDGLFINNTGTGVVAQGNFIGVGADGSTPLGNGFGGISNDGTIGTQLGGSGAGEGNVVSNNTLAGIHIYTGSASVTVEGNLIGVAADGTTPAGNGQDGVLINASGSGFVVGGDTPAAANTIAHNGGGGLMIDSSPSTLLGNSVYDNVGLGIDLSRDGVTPNDPGDIDAGVNGLLNFPVVTSGNAGGGAGSVDFDLDAPAGDYRIELFVSAAGDPTGFGEGQAFGSATTITHTGSGAESFSTLYLGASDGDIVTLTATPEFAGPSYGGTSEFSQAFAIACGDTDGDSVCDAHEDSNIDLDGDPATSPGPDTDGDTTPDYLDTDDDGDLIATSLEQPDPNGDGDPRDAVDSDWDGEPDYLDVATIPAIAAVQTQAKISATSGGLTATLDGNDRFGSAARAIGDVDGDGVVDLAVGAPNDDDGAADSGAVHILFMNTDGSVRAEQKISATTGGLAAALVGGARFGHALTGAGDLDGDGVPDIVVGAPANDAAGTDTGTIHVLFLNADGTVRAEQTISSAEGGLVASLNSLDQFGDAIANVGDVDGDGSIDIVVGATGVDNSSGAIWFLSLRGDGTVRFEQKISEVDGGLVPPLQDGGRFGASLAPLGDIDGDGRTDIAVGQPDRNATAANQGGVWIIDLNSDGTVHSSTTIDDDTATLPISLLTGDQFATAVVGPGDLDGDGVGDLIVGMPTAATAEQAIHVVSLNSDYTIKSLQTISATDGGPVTGLDTGDRFGQALGVAGDLTGNRAVDIVVGTVHDDDGAADAGAVYILTLWPGGQQFVNSTGDASDAVPGDGSCDTGALNSEGDPECTLRAAIEEAEAASGPGIIDFAIPTSDPNWSAATTEFTISPALSLPTITTDVSFDGSTQPEWAGVSRPVIVLDGTSAVGNGLTVTGGIVEIRGLAVGNFSSSGLDIGGSSTVTVVGNHIGADGPGTTPRPNTNHGINLTGTGHMIGGGSPADRNVISGNGNRGIRLQGAADSVSIDGNFIGVDATGNAAMGNGLSGIILAGFGLGAIDVGGPLPGESNIISGNGDGLVVQDLDVSNNITVAGNLIGIGADGTTPVGNSNAGVYIAAGGNGLHIGGVTAPEANTIANNGTQGIRHAGGSGVAIVANTIHSNGGLGIDLEPLGVTVNDVGDADGGPNDLLNQAQITTAGAILGTVTIDFDLDVPAGNYRIDAFTNPGGADASGSGEGEIHSGSTTVSHTGGGTEQFQVTIAGSIGDVVTLTVTEGTGPTFGSTSEFSSAVVTGCADSDGDGLCDIHEDADTDLDGNPATTPGPDSDSDTVPDYLDADDDNDGLLTIHENPDLDSDGDPADAADTDTDTVPNYLDPDDDGDGVDTIHENADANLDGNPLDATDTDFDLAPDYLDTDDDNDGLLTVHEHADPDGDGDPADAADTDTDTIANHLDPDDDGDSIPTSNELADPNADGSPTDAVDLDRDRVPEYLDAPTAKTVATVGFVQKVSSTGGGFVGPLAAGADFGLSASAIGDLDGDGVTDLIVGAPGEPDGGPGRGAAFVLFMNASGTVKGEQRISTTTGGLVGSIDDGDGFGSDVAGVGDIDGDGIEDVVVAASLDDDGGTDRGAVWVLLLNANGTVKAEQKISDTAGGLATALDDADAFGSSVTGLGDLDGDGIVDIAVGIGRDDDGSANAGAAIVLFLNSDGTVKTEQKISEITGGFGATLDPGGAFGSSITGVGDLDGDGAIDLAVGAPQSPDGGPTRGAVWIIHLNGDGTVKSQQKISSTAGGLGSPIADSDSFGLDVAGIGDLDKDGVADLAVGSKFADGAGLDRGAVHVLNLNTDGTVKSSLTIDDASPLLTVALDDSDQLGSGVAALGDLDGDGTIDIAVGAAGDDDGSADAGAMYIINLGLDTDVVVNSTSDAPDTSPGDGVCTTGSLAADGRVACSLRAAIQETNANGAIDTIVFDLRVTDPGHDVGRADWTIQPATALPNVSTSMTIDGFSQPGSSVNTSLPPAPLNSVVRVSIDGSLAGPVVSGLSVTAGNPVIQGLSIGNFTASGIAAGGTGNTTVVGNMLGLGTGGSPMPNGSGVTTTSGTATIGGTAPADANLISQNAFGVFVSTGANTVIIGNRIHTNTALGIDLVGDGPTFNDALDSDSGPNDLLNFPVIVGASESGGTVTIDFDLDVPAGDYRIDIYDNPSGGDPSGFGEAAIPAASVNITHPGSGAQSFSHSFPGTVGMNLSTTTTSCADPSCSTLIATSELSLTTGSLADSDGDGVADIHEDANTDLDNDPSTNPGPDTDADTIPDYLDTDDDGDGAPTADESPDPNLDRNPADAADSDADTIPDYLDADGGVDCSISVGIPQQECDYLVALATSTASSGWRTNTGWLNHSSPCLWNGVTCSGGNVIELDLASNDLEGPVPNNVGDLTQLEVLDLSTNGLVGPIPAFETNAQLRELRLNDNNLTGSLPAGIGALAQLVDLDLDTNRLTGTIPADLALNTTIQTLDLAFNDIGGTIPNGIGTMTALRILNLRANELTGSLPTGLGSLTNLERLSVQSNQLSGAIPAALSGATQMRTLELYGNTLTGAIPAGLSSLVLMETFSIHANQLSGDVPATLSAWVNLRWWMSHGNTALNDPPASITSLPLLQVALW